MEGRFLLDVIIGKGSSVLKLLTGEDKSLLIGWDALLVLDLGFNVLNSVRWLNVKSDSLSGEGLHEDLHTTSESQDEMESGLLLNVVIGKSSAIFQLLSGEDESLLIGWDSFLVLDLSLHILDSVRWFDVKSDGLSSQSLYENLHSTSKSEDKMESRFLLDVIVGEGSAIFELLSGEDKTLLVGWDALLVLNLGLDVVNSVRRLDLKSDGLASQSLDENLHVDCFLVVSFCF